MAKVQKTSTKEFKEEAVRTTGEESRHKCSTSSGGTPGKTALPHAHSH